MSTILSADKLKKSILLIHGQEAKMLERGQYSLYAFLNR
ncbi:hypothetical protein OROMI_007433 [Orobanche minor]